MNFEKIVIQCKEAIERIRFIFADFLEMVLEANQMTNSMMSRENIQIEIKNVKAKITEFFTSK